jgi:predicted nucleotidyltransferase
MITLEELRSKYKPQILALAEKHGAENIRVFGSVARGDADERSDVDLLYSMRPGYGLWEACGMIYEIEESLPFKVDCSWDAQLRPEFRDRILKDAVPL